MNRARLKWTGSLRDGRLSLLKERQIEESFKLPKVKICLFYLLSDAVKMHNLTFIQIFLL